MATDFLDVFKAIGTPLITVSGIAIAAATSRGSQNNDLKTTMENLKSLTATVTSLLDLVTKHTLLIEQVQGDKSTMAKDVRSTRDCVIRIAEKLQVRGPD